MSSNQLFDADTAQGKAFTRSAVQDVSSLLGAPAGGDSALWAFKRARQRRDAELVGAGLMQASQLSWFGGGKAKAATLVDSPY